MTTTKTALLRRPNLLRALRTVLATGGLWAEKTHSGRNEVGTVRKLDMQALKALGYVKCERWENPAARGYNARWFATAAGCIALNEAEGALALAAE